MKITTEETTSHRSGMCHDCAWEAGDIDQRVTRILIRTGSFVAELRYCDEHLRVFESEMNAAMPRTKPKETR